MAMYILSGQLGVVDHLTGKEYIPYQDFGMAVGAIVTLDQHNQDHYTELATIFKNTWSTLMGLEPSVIKHHFGEHVHVETLNFTFSRLDQ